MNAATPEHTEHVHALVWAQHAAPHLEDVCK
jgi:hypothetical protein